MKPIGSTTSTRHRFLLNTTNQGDKVNPTEPPAKSASTSKTGLFATLRALLHAQGSGAPSRTHLHGTGAPTAAPARLAFACATSVSLIAILAILLTSVAPASASEGCPNEARREEQGAAGRALPHCRAYELVSQPYQPAPFYAGYFNGVAPMQNTFWEEYRELGQMPAVQTQEVFARDGNTALFGSVEPNFEGDGLTNNLSRRTPGGWVGENIEPTQSRHGFLCGVASFEGGSENLEQVVFRDGWQEDSEALSEQDYIENCGHDEPRLVPGENEETANLFLRDTLTHSWQLVDTTKQLPGNQPRDPWFEAISADGSHVLFDSESQLTPDAPFAASSGGGITEYCNFVFGDVYVSSGGTIHVLTVLPDGTPVRGMPAGVRPLRTGCGSLNLSSAAFTNSVSHDGERILFYYGGGFKFTDAFAGTNAFAGQAAREPNAPYIHGGLYLREHPGADQSALAHGGTLGAGTLTAGSPTVSALLAATGTATLAAGSDELTSLYAKAGEFRVGQTIAGEGIPPDTTITAVGSHATNVGSHEYEPSLTLSAAVEAGKSGALVPIRATGPQSAFAVGQTLAGEGIPQGTTITAVGAGSLTLSADATANQTAATLDAFSECTEPAKACTIQIDVPEGGSGSAGQGQFQWANSETTKIFFTDEEKLTADSTAAPGNPDLYEYDLEKPEGQRLADLTANTSEPADVLGVSGASEDGSYLYFVAQGVLTGAQQNSHGAAAIGPARGTGDLGGTSGTAQFEMGSKLLTNVTTTTGAGAFAVGQEVEINAGESEGDRIAAGTTITAILSPTELEISTPTLATSSNISSETLRAGSKTVTNVLTSSGAFHVGMTISGPGIPANTWIKKIENGTLTLSRVATANGNQTLSATAANLYMVHGGATTFIANLNAQGGDVCDWTTSCLTSRVSQNGRFIAFNSFDKPTGYDNQPVQPRSCGYFHSTSINVLSGVPCPEVFRYSAAAGANGELTCASCNPTGAPPASEFGWAVIQQAAGTTGNLDNSMHLSNALSNDGEVFFESMEKLVPTDENKTWDVYQYDGGEGASAQLQLISSGKDELPSYFMSATPDGSNVFFVTAQALVRSDIKSDYDLYDARVDGGFAEPLIPLCEAEGCRSAYQGGPGNASPGSATLLGEGNIHPPAGKGSPPPTVKCKKGFVKKQGKCVKQRKKKPKKKKSKKAKKSIRRVAK